MHNKTINGFGVRGLRKSEIKSMAREYAISVSPYKQDKGDTFDTATEKAYYEGFRKAMAHYGHHLVKEEQNK